VSKQSELERQIEVLEYVRVTPEQRRALEFVIDAARAHGVRDAAEPSASVAAQTGASRRLEDPRIYKLRGLWFSWQAALRKVDVQKWGFLIADSPEVYVRCERVSGEFYTAAQAFARHLPADPGLQTAADQLWRHYQFHYERLRRKQAGNDPRDHFVASCFFGRQLYKLVRDAIRRSALQPASAAPPADLPGGDA
jgi:hypothetical protein